MGSDGTSELNTVQGTEAPADPHEMETSVQIIVLVIVVLVATVYAFSLDIRRGAAFRRLIDWLKSDRAAEWQALTRSDRFLTIRAVEILRRGALAGDDDFHVRYRETRHATRFMVAMIVAFAGIALLVLGTTYFGWTW